MLQDVIVIEADPLYPVITIRPVIQTAPGYLYDLSGMLDRIGPKAYQTYRAVMDCPVDTKVGRIRIVTKAEKRKWWLRCQLVKWGVI